MPKLEIKCRERNDPEADLISATIFAKLFHKLKSLRIYRDLTDEFDEYFVKRVKNEAVESELFREKVIEDFIDRNPIDYK